MPNPYHDNQGRFCSRNEMLTEIARLRKTGKDFDARLLEDDLAAIDQDRSLQSVDLNARTQVGSLARFSQVATGPEILVATSDYSPEDVEKISAALDIKERFVDTELAATKTELEALNKAFVEEVDGQFTSPTQVSALNVQLKTSGKQMLDAIYQTARENGVPSGFLHYYLDNRVSPKLGISDGWDKYNDKAIWAAEELQPITLENLPTIKDPTIREKLNATMTQMLSRPEIEKYNQGVEKVAKYLKVATKYSPLSNPAVQALQRNKEVMEATKASIGRSRAALGTIKEWHAELNRNQLLGSASLKDAKKVKPSTIKVDSNGTPVNAWGFNDGELDRIVTVEPTWGGSGALIGMSGRKYQSSEHFANYRSYGSQNYVVVGESDETRTVENIYPEIKSFFISIDSGD